MSITALLSSPLSHLPTPSRHSPPPHFHLIHKTYLSHTHHKTPFLGLSAKAQNDGAVSAVTVEDNLPEKKVPESPSPAPTTPASEAALSQNGSPGATPEDCVAKFEEPRWVGGTWDLKQFQKDGKTNWDAVIDAEVRRRKWLEENPEASSNYDPVVFDTSIIPWWAWMKRFHLPEAEKLNGRAAMIGFFMAYLVDSLTGLGVVDQMANVVCKTLLFVAVAGVLVIRKNEDIETLKKLVEETTFYDKQWQASWKDDTTESVKNE